MDESGKLIAVIGDEVSILAAVNRPVLGRKCACGVAFAAMLPSLTPPTCCAFLHVRPLTPSYRTPSPASSWPVSATGQWRARTSWSSSPVSLRSPREDVCDPHASHPIALRRRNPSSVADTEISLIEETFKNFTERSDIGIILINQFVRRPVCVARLPPPPLTRP